MPVEEHPRSSPHSSISPPPPKKLVEEGEGSPAPPPKTPVVEEHSSCPPSPPADLDLNFQNGSDNNDNMGAAEPDREKGGAMENTLKLQKKKQNDAHAAVAKALEPWLANAAVKAMELSAVHGVPLEDIKAMMGGSRKFKKRWGSAQGPKG
jgi:hypothetical protein